MPVPEQSQLSDRPSLGVRLLRTKLYVPRAHPDAVPRARLLRPMDQSQSCKLTLISAPAGFGKTTLLGD